MGLIVQLLWLSQQTVELYRFAIKIWKKSEKIITRLKCLLGAKTKKTLTRRSRKDEERHDWRIRNLRGQRVRRKVISWIQFKRFAHHLPPRSFPIITLVFHFGVLHSFPNFVLIVSLDWFTFDFDFASLSRRLAHLVDFGKRPKCLALFSLILICNFY